MMSRNILLAVLLLALLSVLPPPQHLVHPAAAAAEDDRAAAREFLTKAEQMWETMGAGPYAERCCQELAELENDRTRRPQRRLSSLLRRWWTREALMIWGRKSWWAEVPRRRWSNACVTLHGNHG